MKAPFKIGQRIKDRDTDVALGAMLSQLNREPFLERSYTATLPEPKTDSFAVVPLWTPAWPGYVIRRGVMLVGASAPKSTIRNRYTTVRAYFRTGPNESEAIGSGWDSRYNSLTGGVPFPLFGEIPSDIAIPEDAVIEVKVTQGGVATFDVTTLRVQIDVAWQGGV